MRRAGSGKSAPVGFIGLGLMGGPMARHLAKRAVTGVVIPADGGRSACFKLYVPEG
ncbi:MAG: NAD(P)-dependent oxidoreductase [Betaproteobacteria bacterium]|nr:NAD(P)-dependent oxidoreductase [Betaproteobacteria bacterium]MBI2291968.1 NAD(P)-dependent oxidoreductase [Betaproteobacteria bacterium]